VFYHIGVAFGGTNCRISAHRSQYEPTPVVRPLCFKVRKISKRASDATKLRAYMVDMAEITSRIVMLTGGQRPLSISVSIAGNPNAERTQITGSGNLVHLVGMPIVEGLRGRFDCPIALGGDLESDAYAEAYFGNAKGTRTLVVGWGTGIGAGLLQWSGDEPEVLGTELGHQLVVDKHGITSALCGCGQECLESICGGTNILSRDSDPSNITSARWKVYGQIFADGLYTSITHFRPQRVVLCGGVAYPQRNWLVLFLMDYFTTKRRLTIVPIPEIVISEFGESADTMGALALGRKMFNGDVVLA
jgi:predicted NBD/HSP70 family sugar kinase